MTKNAKISLTLAAVAVVVVAALLATTGSGSPDGAGRSAASPQEVSPELLVRSDSHRLSTAADGKVTVVEFLDLECEACRAAFPVVERLREEYAGRVTFVMRYFPVPSHRNAELAAQAVEAAAAQGKLEPMYRKMYQTQAGWGDQQVSHEKTFLDFARDLELDMDTFEQAWKDPATIARVRKDREDGLALGVRGTPTFFVNNRHVQVGSYEEFKAIIDAELAR
ncbi:disulfide bond formation protein DsbA [Actinomadura sp. CNU-125]|uniref:DsbA family protein n=1 Tax=Actinomadura sp. CNU-125 TaxID=1904961 RepID=UPI00095C767A|nr:thioredoxin domain-containing protein [Actinomadura sp. CNU-125]OLT35742.1 disulfide bond formation protein DsbA [Actinomadura sp. CNU-125]